MSEDQTIYKDDVGENQRSGSLCLRDLDIPTTLRDALEAQYGSGIRLSPPQEEAIGKGILRSGKAFLVAAPTNSGKTLPVLLRMFTAAIETGSRSVYVVPLKALAEERAEEFRRIAAEIKRQGGPTIKIAITTGDYQLTDDFLGSPPPRKGEIVICTPERLEVILRNPKHHPWACAVSTYVLDEFHLLGDEQRGATFEALVARLMGLGTTSSLVALSATIGGIEHIERWFAQNGRAIERVTSAYRYPRLERRVVLTADKQAYTRRYIEEVTADEDRRLLVFVYRRSDAEKLAAEIRSQHTDLEVRHFHAGVSLTNKAAHAQAFRQGDVKVLVTTTSLKMGVNFPVTDVVVRDVNFFGNGRGYLQAIDVLQMIGRAGRADAPGRAVILCEEMGPAKYFAEHFAQAELEELQPQLVPAPRSGWARKTSTSQGEMDALRSVVLTELSIRARANVEEVSQFVDRTYSASRNAFSAHDLKEQFAFLHAGKLIYKEEGTIATYGITKLGRTVAFSGLSPETGNILAGFLRALIRLDEKRREEDDQSPGYLRRLTDLDFLFLAMCSFEARSGWASNISKHGVGEVQQYIETLPIDQKPLVNLWRSERSAEYPTRRLLATRATTWARLGFASST